MSEAYIVDALRTPVGRRNGALADIHSADLAAVPMQDESIPLLDGLIPIFVVLSIELILSVWIYHSILVRRFFCGKNERESALRRRWRYP